MSVRTFSLAAVLALAVSVTVALAQPQVTVVLTNGQQYTGTLAVQNNNIGLTSTTGQRMSWPQSSIAVIEFTPGQPDPQELQQVSSAAGSNQTILSRVLSSSNAAAVLLSGQIITGKFAGISADGNQITLITSGNQRNNYMSTDVARLYLNPSAAQNALAMNQQPSGAVGTTGTIGPNGVFGQAGTITVPANQQWTPTGITVHQGDRLAFRASGQIRWTGQATDVAGPQGGRAISPNYPVPTAGVGALIGRVGNSQPFLVPSNGETVTMPADGELTLGINDDVVSDNSGSFQVQIARASH